MSSFRLAVHCYATEKACVSRHSWIVGLLSIVHNVRLHSDATLREQQTQCDMPGSCSRTSRHGTQQLYKRVEGDKQLQPSGTCFSLYLSVLIQECLQC